MGKSLFFAAIKISYFSKTYLTFMKIDRGDLKIFIKNCYFARLSFTDISAREQLETKTAAFYYLAIAFFLPCFLVKNPGCIFCAKSTFRQCARIFYFRVTGGFFVRSKGVKLLNILTNILEVILIRSTTHIFNYLACNNCKQDNDDVFDYYV